MSAPAARPREAVEPTRAQPPRPDLVPGTGPVRVSVDNNRCHIYGICEQEAPETFRISEGGSLHYETAVPAKHAAAAKQAARLCPMQAVTVREAPARRPRPRSAARRSTGRIVVAGGGLAGLSAVTRLRERGFDGELVVVGEEPRPPYSRPPLSKQFLTGELRGEDLTFHQQTDAHWLLGTRLVSLDPLRRTVELSGAERLGYDGLVIATGVAARQLPERPLFSPRLRTVRTLEDAVALQAALQQARLRRVVVVGGGFVGCELACTVRRFGMDVTLVASGGRLLERVLGPQLGEVVERIQRRAGVDVRLRTRIIDWADTGYGLRLRLDDGSSVEADLVVLGVGGAPRTEWLRGGGLDIRDGVRCDRFCRALDLDGRPVPGVVAAGDVACWPNERFDAVPRRVEHLIHAVEMGQHAADSLLRGPDRAQRFTPVPRFWSEQHGVRIQAVGLPALAERIRIAEGSLRSERFVATFHRDTRHGPQTVAAVAFDLPSRLLEYRDLIGLVTPAPVTHPNPRGPR